MRHLRVAARQVRVVQLQRERVVGAAVRLQRIQDGKDPRGRVLHIPPQLARPEPAVAGRVAQQDLRVAVYQSESVMQHFAVVRPTFQGSGRSRVTSHG